MTVFLAGFDGGGTGTRLRVTTLAGECVATGRGGSANVATDPELAWRSLADALAQARAALPADARLLTAAGLAGAEVEQARSRFRALTPPDFPQMALETDAFTTCLGAHLGEDGAVMGIGTGSFGYALHRDGDGGMVRRRVGGWGFPQGDEGSGAWIGQRAVSAMLHAHDGRLAEDALTRACREKLGQGGDPCAWAIGRGARDFASLAPLVVSMQAQSAYARTILRDAAAEIESQIATLLRPEVFSGLALCLLGGLGPILAPLLSAATRGRLRPPRGDAVDGALLLARAMAD